MKILRFSMIAPAFLILLCWQNGAAQNPLSVKQEVVKKLTELKPPDKKNYVQRIITPPKLEKLPANLRLDLVYKIGHYEYEYVALRFERKKNEPFVSVSMFSYGSALAFYKKYAKADSYLAKQAKISLAEFDRLLGVAYTLYKSDIREEYVAPKEPKQPAKKGRFSGVGFGKGGGSGTGSSGDGRIIVNLLNAQKVSQPLVKESGTLHADELKNRISNGYEDLRVHLFWQVFYDYLQKNDIFSDLQKSAAEEISVARLQETPPIDEYTDYFRQSLYVRILGEIGTAKALPVLERLTESNTLEKDWDKYLMEDARKAIEKIKSREN